MAYKETAKAVAFRDIAEDCKKRKEGQNYLFYEKDICEFLGIPIPDFRMFNGGYHPKKKKHTTKKHKTL